MRVRHVKQQVSIALRRALNQTGIRQKKVFAVGFNKSGTSSLHALFESLGRPAYHGTRWRDCDDLHLLRSYDCFSDDIPRDLAKLDRLFPGSKFILQVRDLESWIYSRLAHIEWKKQQRTYQVGPGWDATEEAIQTWIRQRNAHHLFVLSYFSDRPADLLVVNFIRDKSAATKICRFLGCEGEHERPMRNTNPRKACLPKYMEMLNRCLTDLNVPRPEAKYDIYCPSLESRETISRFPVDSSMLDADRRHTWFSSPCHGCELLHGTQPGACSEV